MSSTVENILQRKGTEVHCIGPQASVFEAASKMNEHKVGSLLVEVEGRLVGIFTERDVLRRVVCERRDVDQTRVEDVMTSEVACCQKGTTLDEARGVIKNRRIRHLPVVDGEDHIEGMISIGDLNAYDSDAQEWTIKMLQQYVHGQT